MIFSRFLHVLGPRETSMVRYLNLSYSLAETDASGWVREFLGRTPAKKFVFVPGNIMFWISSLKFKIMSLFFYSEQSLLF